MEQAIWVKATASSIGGVISALIIVLFQLPPEAFVAALVCSIIGEFAKAKTNFNTAVLTIVAVTILASYMGKFLIDHFSNTSPTSICAAIGFVCSYYRDYVLDKFKLIIDAVSDWIVNFFKRGG